VEIAGSSDDGGGSLPRVIGVESGSETQRIRDHRTLLSTGEPQPVEFDRHERSHRNDPDLAGALEACGEFVENGVRSRIGPATGEIHPHRLDRELTGIVAKPEHRDPGPAVGARSHDQYSLAWLARQTPLARPSWRALLQERCGFDQ